ncbi:MAG TPA: helix-turn-helix domain-containing protein [Pirellulales bacterium]
MNGFTISLPALRERRDDIPLLIDHFLRVFNRELAKSVRSVTPEARHLLTAYDWPGNVRELQSAIKFAMLHATGEVLTPDWLPEACRAAASHSAGAAAADGMSGVVQLTRQLLDDEQPDIYRLVSAAVDRVVLDEVLRHVKGNQLQAAELLGISRTTLRAKLRSLGLVVEKAVQSDSDGLGVVGKEAADERR